MNFWYNGTALHDYARIIVTSQQTAATPAEHPQSLQTTLGLRLVVMADGFNANRSAINTLRALFANPVGTLRWQDSDSLAIYLNDVPCKLIEHSLPDDPNSTGYYRQEIHVTFVYSETATVSNALTCSLVRSGAALTLSLGKVHKWREGIESAFAADHVSVRTGSSGLIECSGRLQADSSLSITDRRAWLVTQKNYLLQELNGAQVRLVYASSFFDRTVRLARFTADIDQADDYIEWSLSGRFTRFPDEANFAFCQYNARVSDDPESGDRTLKFSGSISAPSATVANAKLDLVRSATLAAQGFTNALLVRSDLDERNVSQSPPTGVKSSSASTLDANPNSDGAAFIELSFDEEYRTRLSNVLNWTLRVSDAEDIRSGLISTTYAGSVTASGATSDAAYTTAYEKAQSLGYGKWELFTGSNLQAEYRQQEAPQPGLLEFVRLDFSYEYQRKGSAIYYEVNAESVFEANANNSQSLSGFVVAATDALARQTYESRIRNSYASYGLRNERTSTQTQARKTGSPTSSPSGTYTAQEIRLEFSFSLNSPKTSAQVSMRYETVVECDYLENVRTVTVSGSVWSVSGASAEAYLETYFYQDGDGKYHWGSLSGTLLGDSRSRSTRTQPKELLPLVGGSNATYGYEVQFSDTFSGKLSDTAAILKTDITEELTYASTRLVDQATPDSVSVIQDCGIEPGQRVVSGSITATTESAALALVRRLRLTPFRASEGSPTTYPTTGQFAKARVTSAWTFAPRNASPIPRTGTYDAAYTENFTAVVVSFSFTEIVPALTFA